MECPVCGTLMNTVCDLEQRDFDGSVFNFIGCVFTCEDCGMVRVKTGLTDKSIAEYYDTSCMYSCLSGVGEGGSSPEDMFRYRYYEKFMSDAGVLIGDIADIGCSRGGYLKYLATRGGRRKTDSN